MEVVSPPRASALAVAAMASPDKDKYSKKSAQRSPVALHVHGAKYILTVKENVHGGVHAKNYIEYKLARKWVR